MSKWIALASLVVSFAAFAQPSECPEGQLPDGGRCPTPECTTSTCGPPHETGCQGGLRFVAYPDGGGWACVLPDGGLPPASGDGGAAAPDGGAPVDGAADPVRVPGAGEGLAAAGGCSATGAGGHWLLALLATFAARRRGRSAGAAPAQAG